MGLTRYDLEVTNIAAGRAWAETHLANDLPAKVQYIDYTLNGAQLYRFRMSTNEQVGLYERCVEVALQFNSPGTIARALFCLGDAVKTQGKTDRSLTHYHKATNLFRVVGDLQQTAVAMAQIALDTLPFTPIIPSIQMAYGCLTESREMYGTARNQAQNERIGENHHQSGPD